MYKLFFTAGAVALLGAGTVAANGFRVAAMDAFAIGRGNGFAATADTPAALFYNPAGIAQLEGDEFLLGAYLIQFSSHQTDAGGTVTGMEEKFEPVPHFYFAHNNPDTPWAIGLGVNLPFGLVTNWPRGGPFSTVATRSELNYLRLQSALAYEVTPQFSVAAGPSFNYSRLQLRRDIGIVPGDEFLVDLDDTALGYTAGALWRPMENHAIGLTYHSRTTLDYKGTAEARLLAPGERATMTMPFPEIVIAGYSYRPSASWNFEVNVDWTNWNRLNTVELRRESGADDIEFHWDSTFMYGGGVTRYLAGGHFISAGYLYAGNAVPTGTFNPAVPDTRLHFYTLGYGKKGERFSWNASYHYVYGEPREIPEPSPAAGRYETQIHGLVFSAGLHF